MRGKQALNILNFIESERIKVNTSLWDGTKGMILQSAAYLYRIFKNVHDSLFVARSLVCVNSCSKAVIDFLRQLPNCGAALGNSQESWYMWYTLQCYTEVKLAFGAARWVR